MPNIDRIDKGPGSYKEQMEIQKQIENAPVYAEAIFKNLTGEEKKQLDHILKDYKERKNGMWQKLRPIMSRAGIDVATGKKTEEAANAEIYTQNLKLRSKYRCWAHPKTQQEAKNNAGGTSSTSNAEKFLTAGIKKYLNPETRGELQNWELELYMLIDNNKNLLK